MTEKETEFMIFTGPLLSTEELKAAPPQPGGTPIRWSRAWFDWRSQFQLSNSLSA